MRDQLTTIDAEAYRYEYAKHVMWTLIFKHETRHDRRYVSVPVGEIRKLFRDVPSTVLHTGVSRPKQAWRKTGVHIHAIDATDPADREKLATYRIGAHAAAPLLEETTP